MNNPFVIVAAGLDFEARLARALDGVKTCCGHGSSMAVELATAIAPGCRGIVSFGIAGGLDPRLRTGTAIVASSVIGANGVRGALPTDEAWSQALLRERPGAINAPLLGVDQPVTEPADKQRLFRQTGAAAIDMESHIAAAVAAEHGLPFAVMRVVADGAGQRVPLAALSGIRDDGSLDALAVMRALLRRPTDMARLPGVARNAWVARGVLARLRHDLGRGFGLPDLG